MPYQVTKFPIEVMWVLDGGSKVEKMQMVVALTTGFIKIGPHNSRSQLTTCCQSHEPMLHLQKTDLVSLKADLASGMTCRNSLQFT